MSRRRYLITYDVSDDKRRTSVFNKLRDQGDHAQFSVFICELSEKELVMLRLRLAEVIHHTEDQVLILDLGTIENPLEAALETLGRAYQPPNKVFVV